MLAQGGMCGHRISCSSRRGISIGAGLERPQWLLGGCAMPGRRCAPALKRHRQRFAPRRPLAEPAAFDERQDQPPSSLPGGGNAGGLQRLSQASNEQVAPLRPENAAPRALDMAVASHSKAARGPPFYNRLPKLYVARRRRRTPSGLRRARRPDSVPSDPSVQLSAPARARDVGPAHRVPVPGPDHEHDHRRGDREGHFRRRGGPGTARRAVLATAGS